jgi:hypothetical protein
MDETAKARAQAIEQTERTIGLLKRAQRANREAVQSLRQLQVNVLGVPVDTIDAQTEGGHGASSQDKAR